MPDVCAAGDQFGLLFRSPDSTSGYLLGLTCAGEYSLKRVTSGSVTDLIPTTASEYILTNGGEINRMGVAAYGGDYHLYANGKYLNSASDYTYVLSGDLGYFVNASTSNPFLSRYEDLKVWTLEDTYYPSSASLHCQVDWQLLWLFIWFDNRPLHGINMCITDCLFNSTGQQQ